MTIKIDITTDLLTRLEFLVTARMGAFFRWQQRWYGQRFIRNRSLHKARQIGADYYFTLEALQDACLTGRNKIFIEPAPSDPDEEFVSSGWAYMLHHAEIKTESTDHKVTKCHITLSNGANIYFLPDNHQGWAGMVGDVYLSEWAYHSDPSHSFQILQGVTCHKKWRRTLYSSRSSQDNAETAETRFLSAGQLFSEPAFYDVVTHGFELYQFDRHQGLTMDKLIQIRSALPDQEYRELYLCQQPIYSGKE